MKKHSDAILFQKIIYTFGIILLYVIGRSIPLYGVDVQKISQQAVGAEQFLLHSIGGDKLQYSLFALGISPYITSSMAVTLINACRSTESRAKTSQKKLQRIILAGTVLVIAVMSYFRVLQLEYIYTGSELTLARVISFVQLFTGGILIVRLMSRNHKYGIGGQSIIIMANVIEQMVVSFIKTSWLDVPIFAGVCLVVIFAMTILENTEIRCPIQRISIHNVHADKNYFAIKLNPVGVMPIMFASAVYSVPRLVLSFLSSLGPDNTFIERILDATTLSTRLGIGIYIFIIYFLTLGYGFITVSPDNISEQLLKGGDSLEDIRAGKKTRRYISRKLIIAGITGATIMSIFVVAPMMLGNIDSGYRTGLASIPSTMILTGLWCNIYREIQAVNAYDSYEELL